MGCASSRRSGGRSTPSSSCSESADVELYRLRVLSAERDLIGSLHPELKRKVRAALEMIRSDPSAGKELGDDLAGLRSFRIGRFRIVYRAAPGRVIELIALGARRTIYEETSRRLRRERGLEP